MRKTMMLLVFILISAVSYAAVFDIINDSYKLKFTLISQEPDPVAPGNYFEVKFRIENLKTEPEKNMEVKIIPKYPFSFYGTEEQIKNIGTVTPGSGATVSIKWKLFADKNAATGDNNIEVWYKTQGFDWIKAGDFSISVRSREAILVINEVKSIPESIIPGTTTKVQFKLENLADNDLRDIRLTLNVLTPLVTASSVTYSELPFTPIGSGNYKTLGLLGAGRDGIIDFELFTDADAASKAYKMPYTLSYSDSGGKNFTNAGIIGLIVDSKPELSVNLDSTDIYQSGIKGKFSVKLVNKGFTDIKFLDVILSETGDFEIISNPDVYIGKLDSDDYETADYTILVKKGASSQIALPLKVEYRDANGHLFSKDTSLTLKLFSGNDLNQRTATKGNSFVGIFIVLIIVVSGIFFWRWRRNRKRQK